MALNFAWRKVKYVLNHKILPSYWVILYILLVIVKIKIKNNKILTVKNNNNSFYSYYPKAEISHKLPSLKKFYKSEQFPYRLSSIVWSLSTLYERLKLLS